MGARPGPTGPWRGWPCHEDISRRQTGTFRQGKNGKRNPLAHRDNGCSESGVLGANGGLAKAIIGLLRFADTGWPQLLPLAGGLFERVWFVRKWKEG